MKPTKYKIKISTTGISMEEIPKILDRIKESFEQGYTVGSGYNEVEEKDYNFGITEV